MQLKQLELSGFKSFVDSTQLDFTRGFTAVVGPNGCGKSNISDAIRWVIGEQSSKSLRGTRSVDLIFNGTSHRKPVNRAEISLTLSSVPKGLRIANVPNLSEEIKVTRCYHRSGESEFYINQIACRLKDITDLFLDVGISPKVLTVIEQGHVQDLVTSKPEDRRVWIEEAAGVLKFKARKNEALRKLDSSGQNLDRISDIVQELKRQVESLKRQANKAERYRQFQSEIKTLSLDLFAKRLQRYNAELDDLRERLEKMNEQKSGAQAKLSVMDNDVFQLTENIESETKSINQQKEVLQGLTDAIRENEHSIEIKKTQMEQSRNSIQQFLTETEQMSAEILNTEKEEIRQTESLKDTSSEIDEEESRLKLLKDDLQGKQSQIASLEKETQELEGQIRKFWDTISTQKTSLTQLETRYEFLTSQDQQIDQDLKTLDEKTLNLDSELEKETAFKQEKIAELEEIKKRRTSVDLEIKELKEKIILQDQALLDAKETFMQESSRLNSLREIKDKLESFGKGVKAILTASNGDRLGGLREVLADVVRTSPEYETAIEAVLGETIESVIVNSYDDSAKAVRYLMENRSGRGRFIPLESKTQPASPIELNGHQGVIGKAVDLVETKEEYRSLMEHLLGKVVIVADFDAALALYHEDSFDGTVVSLNGEVIDSQGIVYGGQENKDAPGLLAQNRELEERALRVETLGSELDRLKRDKQEKDDEFKGKERALSEIQQLIQPLEIVCERQKNKVEQIGSDRIRLKSEFADKNERRQKDRQEIDFLKQEIEALKKKEKVAQEEKSILETGLQEKKQGLVQKRTEIDEASAKMSASQVLSASLKGKRENVLVEIKRLKLQQENLKHRILQRKQNKETSENLIEENDRAILAIEKEILRQIDEKNELSDKIIALDEVLNKKNADRVDLEKETRRLQAESQALQEDISKNEIKKHECTIQVTHIEEKAFEDFNVTLDEILALPEKELDEEQSATDLTRLKEKVQSLGEVNLAALSDFQKANERFLFLKRQEEDLTQSIRLLHQTIEKIDQTTMQLFTDTFNAVNEHFMSTFSRLFEGDKATLSLSDPDNPLESGIEITASPMGKTMHNIALLSGGEKTMTAMALIFSILKVRPSPFCLLDEIDAPLDEANVVRFQQMLKEMAEDTQFIIITHNQKTMSFADTLYGVTMEEHGVSKVVSVNLN